MKIKYHDLRKKSTDRNIDDIVTKEQNLSDSSFRGLYSVAAKQLGVANKRAAIKLHNLLK